MYSNTFALYCREAWHIMRTIRILRYASISTLAYLLRRTSCLVLHAPSPSQLDFKRRNNWVSAGFVASSGVRVPPPPPRSLRLLFLRIQHLPLDYAIRHTCYFLSFPPRSTDSAAHLAICHHQRWPLPGLFGPVPWSAVHVRQSHVCL